MCVFVWAVSVASRDNFVPPCVLFSNIEHEKETVTILCFALVILLSNDLLFSVAARQTDRQTPREKFRQDCAMTIAKVANNSVSDELCHCCTPDRTVAQ